MQRHSANSLGHSLERGSFVLAAPFHGNFLVPLNGLKWGRTRVYYPIWRNSPLNSMKSTQTVRLCRSSRLVKPRVARYCYRFRTNNQFRGNNRFHTNNRFCMNNRFCGNNRSRYQVCTELPHSSPHGGRIICFDDLCLFRLLFLLPSSPISLGKRQCPAQVHWTYQRSDFQMGKLGPSQAHPG